LSANRTPAEDRLSIAACDATSCGRTPCISETLVPDALNPSTVLAEAPTVLAEIAAAEATAQSIVLVAFIVLSSSCRATL
jgi:hypothetical protein